MDIRPIRFFLEQLVRFKTVFWSIFIFIFNNWYNGSHCIFVIEIIGKEARSTNLRTIGCYSIEIAWLDFSSLCSFPDELRKNAPIGSSTTVVLHVTYFERRYECYQSRFRPDFVHRLKFNLLLNFATLLFKVMLAEGSMSSKANSGPPIFRATALMSQCVNLFISDDTWVPWHQQQKLFV